MGGSHIKVSQDSSASPVSYTTCKKKNKAQFTGTIHSNRSSKCNQDKFLNPRLKGG